MKKICGILKITAISVIIGETIASYYNNKDFKNKLDKSNGFDKVKFIFNNLIDVNKRIFTEVSSYDYEGKYEEFKAYAEDRFYDLNSKIDEIKSNIGDFTKDKIEPIIKDLSDRANDLKDKIESEATSWKEKLELEKKLDAIKSKIDDVTSRFQK